MLSKSPPDKKQTIRESWNGCTNKTINTFRHDHYFVDAGNLQRKPERYSGLFTKCHGRQLMP
jgi:hypothetical protein